MFDVRGNEDQRAGSDLSIVLCYLELRVTAHNVIEFILGMRLLRIGPASLQFVESRAHGWDAQKLVIERAWLTRRLQISRRKCLHVVHRSPLYTISLLFHYSRSIAKAYEAPERCGFTPAPLWSLVLRL